MKYKWFVILPLSCILLLFALFPFFHKDPSSLEQEVVPKRYVAILTPDTQDQKSLLVQGLQNAAEELNAYVEIVTVSSFEDQSYEVYRALYSGFDGMIIVPIDHGTDDEQMFRDIEGTLPYLKLLDRLDQSENSFCLASDDAIGAIAAEQLLDNGFRQEDNLHIFIGDSSNSIALNRAAEFERILQEREITVDGTLSIDVNVISSDERIKNYISDNDVNYIFCADGLSTIAAAKCAYSFMYKQPIIIGCGSYDEHIEYFQNGNIQSLLCIDSEQMGRTALIYLDALSKTGQLPVNYNLCITSYDQHHTEGQTHQWSNALTK